MTDESEAEWGAAAREILALCLGEPDCELTPQEGGLTNFVFEAMTSDGPVIIRMGTGEEKAAAFARECRAIKAAADVGVPVPEVIGEGRHGDWAYMLALRTSGEPATDHPKRLDILRDLARLAATKIHCIPTSGFGLDFTFDGDCAVGAGWHDWLEQELKAVDRLEQLCTHGVISEDQRDAFHDTLDDLRGWSGPSVLNHGDLRLKNVLVDPNGKINAIIDWEMCISSIGPHWDLSIALHDLSVDQKEAFIEGYGLTPGEVREFSPFWRLFNALNYAPELKRIVEEGDSSALDRLRNRFSGSLDLYAEPDRPN